MPNKKTKQYDYSVLIGRFQPMHFGHCALVMRALALSDTVIIALGSCNASISYRNPFTPDQRKQMILSHFGGVSHRLKFIYINDSLSDEKWAAEVRTKVADVAKDNSVVLVGFEKADTSTYLNYFSEYDQSFAEEANSLVSATDVRSALFNRVPTLPHTVCPEGVVSYLQEFITTQQFRDVVLEKEHLRDYKTLWEASPFPPVFVTADAVVIQNNKVLLVERGDQPGKGLLALPGGFINPSEQIRDAAIRELREETKIKDNYGEIPHARLGNYIRDDKTTVFDQPNRSLRGRTITHAHLFYLPSTKAQFKVRGSDDAVSADWHTIGPDLKPNEFFEDHYLILEHMLNL